LERENPVPHGRQGLNKPLLVPTFGGPTRPEKPAPSLL
jgi:hypothetical protein